MQKPITVSCDASPKGVGRELLKDGCPVACTTRSLTEAESRYAHIEKKLLAVLFSLERFNQCTYGKKVHVESDHKLLETILKKPLVTAPLRLQRILLECKSTTIPWNTNREGVSTSRHAITGTAS